MKLSLNGVIFGQGLDFEEFLALAAKHGFEGIDSVGGAAEMAATEGLDAVHSLIDKYGVQPSVVGIGVNWLGSDAEFEDTLATFPEALQFAIDIDVPRACTWLPPVAIGNGVDFRQMAVDRWRKIGQIAEKYGVRIGLEFVGPATLRKEGDIFLYDLIGLLEFEEEVGIDSMGILLDSFHWYTAGNTGAQLAAVPVEKIVHVHINDAPDRPCEEQMDMERLLPGEGIIDLKTFFSSLKQMGYQDYMGIETFSAELKALSVDEAAAKAKAAADAALAQI